MEITPDKIEVLEIIEKNKDKNGYLTDVSFSEIEKITGKPVSFYHSIVPLVKEGLIEFEKYDENNVRYCLTDTGRSVIKKKDASNDQ